MRRPFWLVLTFVWIALGIGTLVLFWGVLGSAARGLWIIPAMYSVFAFVAAWASFLTWVEE